MKTISFFVIAGLAISTAQMSVYAQTASATAPIPRGDALSLNASVHSQVTSDLAYVTLVTEAQGPDAGPITQTVQRTINTALAQAKTTTGIEASTGAFSTEQRWDNKGRPNGWTVRSELILKSRDFAILGTLVSKLVQQKLMIVNTGFELSPDLRQREEQVLIERGIAAFRSNAQTAIQAFGFTSYTIGEVQIGSIDDGLVPQPRERAYMMDNVASAAATPTMSIESGRITLNLNVSGTVFMRK